MPNNINQQTLDDFKSTIEAKPYLTDGDLLTKFPEFNGDSNLVKSAHDYVATVSSGKYKTPEELNSKFPEFFTPAPPKEEKTDWAGMVFSALAVPLASGFIVDHYLNNKQQGFKGDVNEFTSLLKPTTNTINVGNTTNKLLTNSNLPSNSIDATTYSDNLGKVLENASQYYNINTAGLGYQVDVNKDGKKTYSETTPVYDSKQLSDEAAKITNEMWKHKTASTSAQLAIADESDPVIRQNLQKQNATTIENSEKAYKALNELLTNVKTKLATDKSISSTKSEDGKKVLDPIQDLNDLTSTNQDLENSVKFLKNTNLLNTEALKDKWIDNAIKVQNAGNENGEIKALAQLQLTNHGTGLKDGSIDVQRYLYNGAVNDKQSLQALIKYKDQPILDDINKQLKQFDVLLKDPVNKLSDEGKQQYADLTKMKINLQSKIEEENKYIKRVDDVIKKEIPDLTHYEAHQDYLNNMWENSNWASKVGLGALSLLGGKALMLKKDSGFWGAYAAATNGFTDFSKDGTITLNDGRKASYKEAALLSLWNTGEDTQELQTTRNGQKVNLSQLESVKWKAGTLMPKVDVAGWLYQIGNVGLDMVLIGTPGLAGEGLEEALLGNTIKYQEGLLAKEGTNAFVKAAQYAELGTLQATKYAIGTTTGFILPSVYLFGPEMIKQELDKGLTLNQSTKLGAVRAGIEGLTERIGVDALVNTKLAIAGGEIHDLIKLTDDAVFRKAIERTLESITSKEAAPLLYKFLYKTDRDALKQFAKGFLKTSGAETLEEEMGLFMNHFATKYAQANYKKDYQNTDPLTLENIVNTALQTIATMLPQSTLEGVLGMKNNNTQLQYSQYRVGMSPSIYKSNIDDMVEKGFITKEEADRRNKLVDVYKEIFDRNESWNTLIDSMPHLSDSVKESRKFEIFQNEIKRENLGEAVLLTKNEEKQAEYQEEAANIPTSEETIAKAQEETIPNDYTKSSLEVFNKEYSDANIKKINDPSELDKGLNAIKSEGNIPNISKEYLKNLDEIKTKLENRKLEIEQEKKAALNIDEAIKQAEAIYAKEGTPQEKEDNAIQVLEDFEKRIRESGVVLEDHQKAQIEAAIKNIESRSDIPLEGNINKEEFVKNLKVNDDVQYKGNAYKLGSLPVDNVVTLVDGEHVLNNIPVKELSPFKKVYSQKEIEDINTKAEEGDVSAEELINNDIEIQKGINELHSENIPNEIDVDIDDVEKVLPPPVPASVLHSIGTSVGNLFLKGTTTVDKAFKTAQNSLKQIINKETINDFKVLVLRPSQLIERLGGLEAIKDLFENDYNYWKENGYDTKTKEEIDAIEEKNTHVKLVLVDNAGQIVYFNEKGNVVIEGGIPSIHNVPTIYKDTNGKITGSATEVYDKKTNTIGFKRKDIDEKEEDAATYRQSLEDLEALRKNPPISLISIQRMGMGIVTKFVTEPISTSSFIKNLNGKLEQAEYTLPDLKLFVSTTPSVDRVEGQSYLTDSKYGFNFPISRPYLANVQLQGFIDALIKIGTENNVSKTLNTFEARKAYLDRYVYFDDASINLIKNKNGEAFKINKSFFDGYSVSNIENVKAVGDFYYFNISENNSEAFKTALEHALGQKKLNIKSPENIENFNIPIFTEGKLSFTPANYEKFIIDNTEIYQDVNDNKDSNTLAENGVQAFPGTYMMLDNSNIVPETKQEVKQEIKQKPEKSIDDIFDTLNKDRKLESKFSKTEWNDVKNWWSNSPLSKYIDLNHFINIVNSGAHATFFNNVVTLYNTATPRMLYHEAYHGFSQLFLTKRQKTNLYNELRKKSGVVDVINESGNLVSKSYSQLTNREAEEVLGDNFEEYADSNGTMYFDKDLSKQTIFQKMWNFIKELISPDAIKNVYKQLYKGNFNNVPSLDNALFGKLNKAYTAEDGTIIGSVDVNNYINTIDSIITSGLERRGKMFVLFTADEKDKKKNFDGLYEIARLSIQEKLESKTLPQEQQDKLQFLYDNFNGKLGFEKTYIENSSIFSGIKTEEEIDEEEITSRDGAVEWAEKNKKSAIKQASKQIVFLMSTLSRGELNEFGFPKLLPLSTTWYRLQSQTQGITDPVEMYDVIVKLGNTYPEYKQLVNNDKDGTQRLPKLENYPDFNIKQISLLQSFIQAFSKPKIDLYEGVYDVTKGGFGFYNTKSATKAIDKLGAYYTANFKTIEESSYIIKNNIGENVLDVASVNKDFGVVKDGVTYLKKDKATRIAFIKSLGIDLSDVTINSKAFNDLITDNRDTLNQIFNGMNHLNSYGEKITSPIKDISGVASVIKEFKYKSEATNIDALLQIEVDATNEWQEDMAMLPSGDMKSQYSQFSKTSLIYAEINNKEKYPHLDDFIKVFPEYSVEASPTLYYTLWMNSLFQIRNEDGSIIKGEEFGKRRNSEIELIDIGGFKTKTDRDTVGNKTTDLFSVDKIFYDINSFFANNIVEHMRYGDKGSAFGTQIKYNTTNSNYPVAISEFDGELIPSPVQYIFEDYLKGTILEIQRYNKIYLKAKEEKGITIAKYDKTGNGFRMFTDILPEEIKQQILENINNNVDDIFKDIDIKLYLEKFFKDRVEVLKDKIRQGITNKGNFLSDEIGIKDTKGLSYSDALNAFVVSNYIYNYEQMMFINGDVTQFKSPEDVHKRLSADSATGDFSVMSPIIKYYLNATGREQEQHLFNKKSQVEEFYKSVVLKDREIISNYLKDYLNTVIKNSGKELNAEELINMDIDEAKEALKDAPFNIFNTLKAFKEVNETDALGLCTLDFYRNFKIIIGQWNDLAEKAYIKAAKGIELSNDELYYFVPIKAQYSGTIANTEQHFGQEMRIDAFDKFALIPMIPTAIKGKPLEGFNDKLVKENIGYGIFESGSKKAALQNNGEYENFENREVPYLTNDKYFHYLKEQVYIEPKVKPNIIFATQFNKLFNVDMFAEGKPISEKIGAISAKYNAARQQLVDIELKKVRKELGIRGENEPINFKALASLLQKEFKTKDVPDNIQDFIRTDNEGNLVYSLDSSLARQQITNILLSIVNNRLIKNKLNGDNFVQTAFTGWDKDSTLKLYEIKERENGEKYVSKMQVKVSINKFKPLLKLVDEIDEGKALIALNQLLKDEEWVKEHEAELTMVGVRIPVQGANSMLNCIVQEFLPASTGSLIVFPSEITAIAGSDFDIDKVSMYIPNFKEDGKLPRFNKKSSGEKINDRVLESFPGFVRQDVRDILESAENKKERDEQIEKYIIELYEHFSSIRDKSDAIHVKITALKQVLDKGIEEYTKDLPSTNKKSILQNEMISLLSESLEQPEMFESLITPNSTSVLKPLADEIKKIVGRGEKVGYSTLFDYSTQINQFEANLVGKKSLGIAAKNNTFSQLFKQHNVFLNNFFKYADGRVENKILLKHNFIQNGPYKNISLAKEYDANGEYKISEIISQFMNGFVDVAKDAWVFDLGATFEATPTLLYLNHAGVPIREAIYLVNQSIIREYLALKKLKNFQMGKLLNSLYQNNNFTDKKIKEILQAKFPVKEAIVQSSDIYNEETLKENISKSSNKTQRAYLEHYIELEQQAQGLRELTSALDFDTANLSSVFAAFEKEELYQQVLSKNIFNKEGIEAIKKDSVISMLDMNDFVKKNFTKFFKLVELPQVNEFLLSKINDASFGNKEVFESRFKNDLIGYAYNAFGNSFQTIRPQFNGEMINRLNTLLKDQPELIKKYSILKNLVGNTSTLRKDIVNLKLKSEIRETNDVNLAIDEIKKGLLDDNLEVREFFKDYISFAFIQSGLQKSPLYMTNLLPTEQISNEIEKVLPLMKEIVENNGALEEWYDKYFVPNNAQIIKPKVKRGLGLIKTVTQDGKKITVHTYPDEAYRLKTPVKIEIKSQEQKYIEETKNATPVNNVKLNPEQEIAVKGAIDFIKNGNPKEYYVIEGKAGTGKTTIAEQIVREFPNSATYVAALSHKAKSVIREKFRKSKIFARFESIASLLGQSMNLENGIFEAPQKGKSVPIENADIIIIDEASMINEQAMELIFEKKSKNSKVIFLGDVGQLPPIRTVENSYYKDKKELLSKKSPVFEGKNKSKLLERVRQGEDSPILPFADHFWENSQKNTPDENPAKERKNIISDKGALIFTNSFNDIKQDVLESFKEAINTNNPNHIKVVTYKNNTRQSINKFVHDSIFGVNSPEYNPNELIIFNDAYGDIENSFESQISTVSLPKRDGYDLSYVSAIILLEDVPREIDVIMSKDKEKYAELVSQKFKRAFALKGSPEYRNALEEAWGFKNKYAKIDYGYAITSHKSQGSTYDIVVVDEKDIMSVGPISNKEKSESIYTALTRPKNIAIVISSLKVEDSDVKIEELNSKYDNDKTKIPNLEIEDDIDQENISNNEDILPEEKTNENIEEEENPGCVVPF
jgi:exodeoxyribonuclease-5